MAESAGRLIGEAREQDVDGLVGNFTVAVVVLGFGLVEKDVTGLIREAPTGMISVAEMRGDRHREGGGKVRIATACDPAWRAAGRQAGSRSSFGSSRLPVASEVGRVTRLC